MLLYQLRALRVFRGNIEYSFFAAFYGIIKYARLRFLQEKMEKGMKNNCLLISELVFIYIISIFLGTPAFCQTSGKVIIFHDSSLNVPFKHLEMAVEAKFPKLDIQLEAGGSLECARKITEEKRACDIMASDDYMVIDDLLIPEYADWNVRFAGNQIVLCYTDKSSHEKKINTKNWHKILLKKDVSWGHSDPNLYPVGYRALMVFNLAENNLKIPGLMDKLLHNRISDNIFGNSSKMITRLQEGKLDYCWEYLSVAVQHGLKYLTLPDEINLGNYKFDTNYNNAFVKVTGKTQGSFMELKGQSIAYGVTMLKGAPNKEGAIAFLQCLFNRSGGLMVLESMGQPPIVPCTVANEEMKALMPSKLKKMVHIKP